jgi:hypothetical protein
MRMTGDAMREIGVLLVVLAPLDSLFSHDQLTAIGFAVIVVVAVICFLAGLVLGLER